MNKNTHPFACLILFALLFNVVVGVIGFYVRTVKAGPEIGPLNWVWVAGILTVIGIVWSVFLMITDDSREKKWVLFVTTLLFALFGGALGSMSGWLVVNKVVTFF
jgi:hypothetical protein